MEKKKSSVAILATMAMMSAQSTYLNHLDELTDSDRPRSSVSYAKRNLTKKQIKGKAKSKKAKKARKARKR